MAECHVVHLGRDSRLLAVSVRIRRESPDALIVDFDYRGQIVPVTEIRMTTAQARALADDLTDGLVTRLTNERYEAQAAYLRERWLGSMPGDLIPLPPTLDPMQDDE